MLNKIALCGIKIYQRHLSPLKGYRCAHGILHNGDSCSGAITKIIMRRGIWSGYRDIQQQFHRCSNAYVRLLEADNEKGNKRKKRKKEDKKESGVCDCLEAPFHFLDCIPTRFCRGPSKGPSFDNCDLPFDCSL